MKGDFVMQNVSKQELIEARHKLAKHCQYLDEFRKAYWEKYKNESSYIPYNFNRVNLIHTGACLADQRYDDMEFVLLIFDEIIAEEK